VAPHLKFSYEDGLQQYVIRCKSLTLIVHVCN